MTGTETLYRSCPTCEACCGLVLEVDRQQRKVISIKGNPDDPRSKGYVCAKSQAFNDVYEDPNRLRKPVRKTPQGWQEISWDEAFQLVSDKLGAMFQQHGKDAIAMFMGNPNGHNAGALLYVQLLMNMLNTERFFSAATVDQQPQNLVNQLLYGDQWFFPIPDLERTDFFLCLGANPVVSQGSLMSAPNVEAHLKAIQARGGKIVVIDPRRSETAAIADRHLFIKPGTDAYLLLAFVHLLFRDKRVDLKHLSGLTDGLDTLRELSQAFSPQIVAPVTGIAVADIEQLVSDFCTADKAACYGRIGLCTQQFGTLASWLVQIVNILTGNLDREGGMMFPRPATGQTENTGEVPELPYKRWQSRARGFPEFGSQLPAALMAEELELDGKDKVHALITISGNPVLSVPNGKRLREAMTHLDFMLAIDIYINETTSMADLILPPVCQMEHSNFDFLFQGTSIRNFVCYSPRIFQPAEDSKEQWQIMLGVLGAMMGMSAADLDELMLAGMLDMIAAQEGKPAADKMRAQLSDERGPDRLIDTLLRVGPYGDQFDADKPGLNLNTLKQGTGAQDLGPLQPRLPELLRTPGRRLQLIHELLIDDIPRLTLAMQSDSDSSLLLIGRRQIRDMNTWTHNLPHYASGKNRCTLLIHPNDATRLELCSGDQADIISSVGKVRTEVHVSDEMMPGVVSLPHGFGHIYDDVQLPLAKSKQPGASCNDVIDDSMDLPSGTSITNGVPVTVRKAAAAG